MDALAAALVEAEVVPQAYGWPNSGAAGGSAIVGYPEPVQIGVTYSRGYDRATFPVWILCGSPDAKAARDAASLYLSTSPDAVDALEQSGAGTTCHVTFATVESVDVGGTEYLAVRYDVDVLT